MGSAATAPVLESLKRADQELRILGSHLFNTVSPETEADVRKEYDDLTDQIRRREQCLTEDSPCPSTPDELSADVGKIELAFSSKTGIDYGGVPHELKKPIRDIRVGLELNDRLFVLSENAPRDERTAQAALRWFSQKEEGCFIDFLFEVTNYLKKTYGSETIELLSVAKEGILRKGYTRLLDFYGLSEVEMLQTIERTIEYYNNIRPSTLKDFFKAEVPTQVLSCLGEMQSILNEHVETTEIRRWLEAPNKLFASQSPRTALISGHTFKVYQFLIGLAHGVHT